VAVLTFMIGRLVWNADFEVAAMVAAGAAAVTLANFLHFSRQLLANSRTALRTARAKAQENQVAAEAANRAKSVFLATMSHEIRTPLNGVLGMAQAMAAEELSDLQRDRLAVIHRSGESLLAILNDLLDLSKIEAGKLELESIEFDLGEVARGAHSAFTALANKKGLASASTSRRRPAATRATRPLRQILYNLISNALKFTEQGEIRVVAAREGETLVLSVRDTGSASRTRTSAGCSASSTSSTRPPRGGSAARAWACRSAANWPT
jgi:signal transduction histidine kinase